MPSVNVRHCYRGSCPEILTDFSNTKPLIKAPVQCLAAGLLALNDKMEVLDRPVWGSVSQYMTCTCPLTWRDLHKDFTFFESTSRTGGLGKLMVEDKFENWWCTIDHMCAPSGDYMCFVWGEVERRFIPWGLNSELKLVRKGPFAAVDAPSSRLLAHAECHSAPDDSVQAGCHRAPDRS